MPHTKCALCKRINAAASRFCIACGTPLNPCAVCSAVNPAFATDCLNCAHALATYEADVSATAAAGTALAPAMSGQIHGDEPGTKDFSWHTVPVSESSSVHAGNQRSTGVSEQWAGSAPAEALSPTSDRSAPERRARRGMQWTLYALVLVGLVSVAYYVYRGDVLQARHAVPASAPSGTAAGPDATSKASPEGAASERDTSQCRRAVAALGLCAPESHQRRD